MDDSDTLLDLDAGAALDAAKDVKACPECRHRFGIDHSFCPFDGTKLALARQEPATDPLVGAVVDGRYHVERRLGEGGMGAVYRVRHTALNRSFAMKVLRRDVATESDLSARFIHEAQATARLRHPHIVSITDFGQLPDETPFFVMELLVGQTLARLIQGHPVEPSRACQILLQVASALEAAHEAGVVHRDVKPENVFLAGPPRGPGDPVAPDDVKVVDFGAAQVLGASRITKAGVVFGTPHYMSPEQASGQPVDHRADIYAFGVMMYEMLTGRVPFEAETYMGVLTQHMFVQPRPPSAVRPELARELGRFEAIALRALEKRPEDRYQTMGGVTADLERAVRGESLESVARPSRVSSAPMAAGGASPRGALMASGEVPIAGLSRGPSRPMILGGAVVVACAAFGLALSRGRTVPAVTAVPFNAAAVPGTNPAGPAPSIPPPPAAPSVAPASSGPGEAGAGASDWVPVPSPSAPAARAAPAPRHAAPEHPAPRRALGGTDLADPWSK